MTLNYGWSRVNSDFNLAFQDSNFSVKWKNYITPLPADTKTGWCFGENDRIFKLIDVRFKTTEDAESMLDKLKDLQNTGNPFKVEWQIHSTGGAGDYFEFDGDTGYMMCLCNKIGNLSKLSPKDDPIYSVDEIEFEEAEK